MLKQMIQLGFVDKDNDMFSYDYTDSDNEEDDESILDGIQNEEEEQVSDLEEPIKDEPQHVEETTDEVRSKIDSATLAVPEELRSKDDNGSTILSMVKENNSSSNKSQQSPQNLRSKVDESNIISGPRTRTKSNHPNVGSFAGKKYHANMLNIGQDKFAHFERIKVVLFSTTVGICFTQMTASKGIELYRQKAVAAMFKEYKQLDDLMVLARINPDTLMHEEKQ